MSKESEVDNYLEFPIGRLWRLTAQCKGDRTEYIVPEARLADLVRNIASDPNVRDFQCVPYIGSAHEGVWMSSGPARDVAA
jgi:hypothetical protein